MSERLELEIAVAMLGGDRAFLQEAIRREIVRSDALDRVAIERVRVARTLIRDLEVNWEGVEVVLRLREELLATRRQVHELVEALRARAGADDEDESADRGR